MLLFAMALVLSAKAQQPTPKVRAHLDAPTELWVGEKAVLVVELLAPGYFAGSPAFDLPRIPGVLIMPPRDRPVLGTEEHDGISYNVQRHELAVFCERAGEHAIPPISVRFGVRATPLDKESIQVVLKTQPQQLTAKLPPGAEKLAVVISARDLKAEESWTPQPGKAKAGDAFRRTITITAPDVPSMIFPPFPVSTIDGLGIYAKEPEVLDTGERGQMMGRRRQTLTYVCERPGHFTVPALQMTWWDLDSYQLKTVKFPTRNFDVVPNPALASAGSGATAGNATWERRERLSTLACLGIVALALVLWRYRRLFVPIANYWRPVHLAELNPGDGSGRIDGS